MSAPHGIFLAAVTNQPEAPARELGDDGIDVPATGSVVSMLGSAAPGLRRQLSQVLTAACMMCPSRKARGHTANKDAIIKTGAGQTAGSTRNVDN